MKSQSQLNPSFLGRCQGVYKKPDSIDPIPTALNTTTAVAAAVAVAVRVRIQGADSNGIRTNCVCRPKHKVPVQCSSPSTQTERESANWYENGPLILVRSRVRVGAGLSSGGMGNEIWAGPMALFFLASVAVMAAPREHLVTCLPGQPVVPFKQYSGYVTVDEAVGTALFYYFVEAEQNASSLPLALWLNGGPGCSSIGGGAFTELGPFYPSGSGRMGLRRNPHSWNKVANLLFLDSPAGVGWSYSNGTSAYSYNDGRVAHETLTFLLKWYEKFPEYKSRDLFLTGESYAGHYIPQLAEQMLRHNTNPGAYKFNLKAITIGNPLLNYSMDTSATYFFLWSHGLISDKTYKGVTSFCDFSNGVEDGNDDDETPVGSCPFFVGAAHDEVGGNINMYDVTLDICPPPIARQALLLRKLMTHREDGIDVCIDDEITSYFNQRQVQEALHANVTGLPYAWEACSGVVEYKFEDQLQDMLPILSNLLKHGLRVWIFSGDQDSVVPLTGTRSQMSKLAKDLNLRTITPYSAWYVHGQVGGWSQAYEKLVYATVRGAAHMVPYAQPERALILFRRFLSGKPLPTSSSTVGHHL